MSHPANGPNTVHVYGAGPEDAIGLALRKTSQIVLFFPPQALPTQTPDLVVCISPRCDDEDVQSFTRWAHDTKIPSFHVCIRNDTALIGPLTLSDKAGCGHCAFERLAAAAATSRIQPPPVLSLEERTKRISPVIVREVLTIFTDGPQRSELVDYVLAVDFETLDESLHRVIPLPHCAVCGGAAAFPSINHEPLMLSADDSQEVVLGVLEGWVDRRTGVICDLVIEPPKDVSLPIIATAAPPHVIDKDGSLRRLPIGWGKGLTVSGAVLSAVGEAIERYSASLPDPKRIVYGRPEEFDGEFLDPRNCALYTNEQYERKGFPYVPFDPNVIHQWALGNWSDSGKPVWVPVLFAYLSIELRQEEYICQGTSNGLAASTDNSDAARRAILELVERDAFMAAWLTGSPAQCVELDDTLDPLLRNVLEGIQSLGATVEVYTLPASVIGTTVLCLAIGDGEQYPGITFGLGSDLDANAALRQAVLELGQTGPHLRRMMRSKSLIAPNDPTSVREMLDHAAYYFPRERASAFDSLRNKCTTIRLRDFERVLKRSLADCVSALNAAGVRVALVDVTSADVATGPFHVVRAVSSDLQPIWYGYGLERTAVERIRRMKLADNIPPINPIW